MKRVIYIIACLLIAILTVSCGSEKAIRKGDQYAAVMEYYEAAREYKKAYRKIPAKERGVRICIKTILYLRLVFYSFLSALGAGYSKISFLNVSYILYLLKDHSLWPKIPYAKESKNEQTKNNVHCLQVISSVYPYPFSSLDQREAAHTL